jgi:signal transduction histidine kinase
MAELIIPPAFRERHRHGLARYLSTGASTVLGKRLELEAMRSDGSTFPAELTVTRVDLPGPAIFTGYIRDITERKRAEVEVERALQAEREASVRLRELDEMKDMFLQAVSHDLRTPLTAIMGLAVTLERNDDVGLSREDDRDLRRRLVANARKLDRILSNLLDLERLLRGAVAADRAPTWLPGLVRQVVDEADFLAGRQVTVHADPLVAEVDAAKVERILENLLVNAVKHTEPGTPVWIRVRGRGDAVLMAVEDAGAGVAAEMRETIFQPFQRGNGEQVTPGTGIGLSLVARFAQLHGGRAWVEERDGGGASFNVLLPEARPTVAEV